MLVVDASVIVAACLAEDGWDIFGSEELVAPALGLSEASSALHEARWRGELSDGLAEAALGRLTAAPITLRPFDTIAATWALADDLGWAKTYDAEYVVLAQQLGCRLVTLDSRLRRGGRGQVEIIGPAEVAPPSAP